MAVFASNARRNFFTLIHQVNDDRSPVEIVTRNGKDRAYLVAAAEYEALRETAYLMQSPANAARLREALADARAGRNLVAPSQAELDALLQGTVVASNQ